MQRLKRWTNPLLVLVLSSHLLQQGLQIRNIIWSVFALHNDFCFWTSAEMMMLGIVVLPWEDGVIC